MFSRTLMGGREALLVTGVATPLAVWGGLWVSFGLVGGRLDEVLMRIVDAFCRYLGFENAGANCHIRHWN